MTLPSKDRLEAFIEEALSEPETVRAPEGFVERAAIALRYAESYRRQRRQLFAALAAALGGAAALAVVGALFWYAIDVPRLAMERIPGILGRIDGLQIALAQSGATIAMAMAATVAAILIVGWAVLRLRRRAIHA